MITITRAAAPDHSVRSDLRRGVLIVTRREMANPAQYAVAAYAPAVVPCAAAENDGTHAPRAVSAPAITAISSTYDQGERAGRSSGSSSGGLMPTSRGISG